MNDGNMTRERSLAFTMVELVFVVVIVGILTGIAVPRLASAAANQRIEAAGRRVEMDIQMARRRAKVTSTAQTISFDAANDSYAIAGLTDPNHSGLPYVVNLDSDPYSIVLASATFGAVSDLTFDGYGQPIVGGFVVLTLGGNQKIITVEDGTVLPPPPPPPPDPDIGTSKIN